MFVSSNFFFFRTLKRVNYSYKICFLPFHLYKNFDNNFSSKFSSVSLFISSDFFFSVFFFPQYKTNVSANRHTPFRCFFEFLCYKRWFSSYSISSVSESSFYDKLTLPKNFDDLKNWFYTKKNFVEIINCNEKTKNNLIGQNNELAASSSCFSSSVQICALRKCLKFYTQLEKDINELSLLLTLEEESVAKPKENNKLYIPEKRSLANEKINERQTLVESNQLEETETLEDKFISTNSILLKINTWKENEYMIDMCKELKTKQEEIFKILLDIYEKIDVDEEFGKKSKDGERDELNCNSIIFEIRPGVGGEEACIFAKELFHMYEKFCAKNNYNFSCIYTNNNSSKTGYREAVADISGDDVLNVFRYEAGVHRVQRIPRTDKKQNKIHTSTASISILHKPLDTTTKVILKNSDLKVETMRSGGPGGQSVNKGESAVRIVHLPTNISVVVQQTPSQLQNKAYALELLKSKLLNQKMALILKQEKNTREKQIGSGDRSEKIRTINFQHDTLIDHRCGMVLPGAKQILEEGGSELLKIIERLNIDQKNLEIQKAICYVLSHY